VSTIHAHAELSRCDESARCRARRERTHERAPRTWWLDCRSRSIAELARKRTANTPNSRREHAPTSRREHAVNTHRRRWSFRLASSRTVWDGQLRIANTANGIGNTPDRGVPPCVARSVRPRIAMVLADSQGGAGGSAKMNSPGVIGRLRGRRAPWAAFFGGQRGSSSNDVAPIIELTNHPDLRPTPTAERARSNPPGVASNRHSARVKSFNHRAFARKPNEDP
jgi:hypothetical protein